MVDILSSFGQKSLQKLIQVDTFLWLNAVLEHLLRRKYNKRGLLRNFL